MIWFQVSIHYELVQHVDRTGHDNDDVSRSAWSLLRDKLVKFVAFEIIWPASVASIYLKYMGRSTACYPGAVL